MRCKFCDSEILEEDLFCPFCGRGQDAELTEETPVEVAEETAAETTAEETTEEMVEEKKEPPVVAQSSVQANPGNFWKVLAIVACALLALLLALVIYLTLGNGGQHKETNPTTAPTVPTTTAPVVFDTFQGDPAQLAEVADTVIASIGEHTLTNRQFQVFYWATFFEFVEYSGSYLSNLGLDYTKPLNTQTIPDGTQSWEQYFVDLALKNWHRYTVLSMEAKKAGMELDADTRSILEELPAALEENAETYGYDSADAMIQADYGAGVTLEDYLWYMEIYHLGMDYYNSIYEAQTVTRDEVSAYFDTVAENFISYGITKDSGKLLDVRHILLQPEGCQINEQTGYVTATDAQWADCLADAQELLDSWKNGEATAASFGALAAAHSVDPGSAENGGLYEAVGKGQMVEAFDAWLFDESRLEGDTGVVKTEFGYHIMYFVGGDEGWYIAAKPELIQSKTQEALNALLESNPSQIDMDLICIDSTVLGIYKES